MVKKIIHSVFTGIFLISCVTNDAGNKEDGAAAEKPMPEAEPKQDFVDVTFASKKDLVCGMPVTAGISDTAHFEGKIYGFCAPECKVDFLKDPNQYLTINK